MRVRRHLDQIKTGHLERAWKLPAQRFPLFRDFFESGEERRRLMEVCPVLEAPDNPGDRGTSTGDYVA